MERKRTERHEIALDLAVLASQAWTDHGIRQLEDYLLVVAAFQQAYPDSEQAS